MIVLDTSVIYALLDGGDRRNGQAQHFRAVRPLHGAAAFRLLPLDVSERPELRE